MIFRNPCDPDFPFALFESEHQSVRLEGNISTLFFCRPEDIRRGDHFGLDQGRNWTNVVQIFLYAAYDRAWEAFRLPFIYRRALAQSSLIFETQSRSSYTSELSGRKFTRTTGSASARLEMFLFFVFFLPCFCIFSNHVKIVPYVLHLHDHLKSQTTIHKQDSKVKQYRTAFTSSPSCNHHYT